MDNALVLLVRNACCMVLRVIRANCITEALHPGDIFNIANQLYEYLPRVFLLILWFKLSHGARDGDDYGSRQLYLVYCYSVIKAANQPID